MTDAGDSQLRAIGQFVTGRAMAPLVTFGDGRGWDQEELLQGTGITEQGLRDLSHVIPWNSFVHYLNNFEGKIGGPAEIRQLEEVMAPAYKRMASFLGLMAAPRTIFRWLNRWAGPNMFPPVQQQSREPDEHTLVVDLRIPDELDDCPTFFRITEVMFRTAPTMVGSKPALVELTVSGRHGHYEIQLPPSSTLRARVGRAFRAFLSGEAVLDELVERQDRLLENHGELQRTHKELLESEKNFRALIERIPTSVLVLNGEETVYANPAMHDFLGLDAYALDDGSISQFVRGGPLVDRVAAILNGEESARSEIEFHRQDGETVIGDVVPLSAIWNGAPALVLVIDDVTERNRLMDRALQLDRVIAVGTMAAGVAHEINNPMAFIHSNLEYAIETLTELKDGADPLMNARLHKALEALAEAVDGSSRVRSIVWDLKTFSRAPEETRTPVDLVEAVRSAINMSWHEVRSRAKVRTDYDEVPQVLANANRLSQVVLNLVINAAQAMPDRERDLNLVTIRTLGDPERGVIEVEDNGTGIAPEHMRRIFDPFFTTKPVGEGTGLGLWIVRDIIARLGGEVSVDSTVGRGTLVRIELPYADAIDAEAPPEVKVEAQPVSHEPEPDTVRMNLPREPGRHRVLMIDDEKKILRVVDRVLIGCDVVTFSDPHRAMQHLRNDADFDVVLCDATMPGMNGRDLFVRLQAEYPALAERFVLVTGGLTNNWERTEFPVILTKPFDLEELRSIVELIASSLDAGEPPSLH